MTYEDGTSITGKISTDRICPSSNLAGCSNSQQFVVLTEADGLGEEKAGKVGMWSGNSS